MTWDQRKCSLFTVEGCSPKTNRGISPKSTRRVAVEREIINVYDVFQMVDHTINCYKEPLNMKRLEP